MDRKQITKQDIKAIKRLKKSGFNVDVRIIGTPAYSFKKNAFTQTGYSIEITTQRLIN